MTDMYEGIKAGLEDAVAKRGKRYKTETVDIKALRERLNMTQETFAQSFRIPLSTLRNWEQEHRLPQGPTSAYLKVIEKNPQAVLNALAR